MSMKGMLIGSISASVMASWAALMAQADITFYDKFYNSYFIQTGPTDVPVPTNNSFYARIFTTPGDAGAAWLTVPGSAPVAMSDNGSGTWFVSSFAYVSFDDVLSLYPSGEYTYAIRDGALGVQSGTLTRPATLPIVSAVPRIEPASFNRLFANPSPQQPIRVGINTFTFTPPANLGATFATAVNLTTGALDFVVLRDPSDTSFTIPAGVLAPSTGYQLSVYFSGRVQNASSGFNGSISVLARDLVTTVIFTTGPGPCNPGDLCGSGAAYSDGVVDIGADQQLTIEDFVIFLSAFTDETGCPTSGVFEGACNPADVCGAGATYLDGAVDVGPDGELTIDDFVVFLSAFVDGTGCS